MLAFIISFCISIPSSEIREWKECEARTQCTPQEHRRPKLNYMCKRVMCKIKQLYWKIKVTDWYIYMYRLNQSILNCFHHFSFNLQTHHCEVWQTCEKHSWQFLKTTLGRMTIKQCSVFLKLAVMIKIKSSTTTHSKITVSWSEVQKVHRYLLCHKTVHARHATIRHYITLHTNIYVQAICITLFSKVTVGREEGRVTTM